MEYFYITFSKIAHLIFVLIMNLSVKHMSLATKWYPSISFTHINFRHIHHFSLWQLRPTISQKNINAVTYHYLKIFGSKAIHHQSNFLGGIMIPTEIHKQVLYVA